MVVARSDVDFDDWDRHWKDIENTMALNPAHEYRRFIVFRNLNLASVPSPRVLDVGSGLGDLLIALSDQYPEVPKLGLELAQTGVDIANRRLPQATFLQRDLIAGNEGPGVYAKFATHAVCSEVLEHVDDPVRLLENARAYMAKGCRLVVTVPGGPRSALDRHIGHRRHFTPASLCEVLNKAGFHGGVFCRRRISILQFVSPARDPARQKAYRRCGQRTQQFAEIYLRCFSHAIQAEYGQFPVWLASRCRRHQQQLIAPGAQKRKMPI